MVRGAAGTSVIAAAPGVLGGGLAVPNRSGGATGTTTICTPPEEPGLEGVTMRTGMTRRAGGGGVGSLCCSGASSLGA